MVKLNARLARALIPKVKTAAIEAEILQVRTYITYIKVVAFVDYGQDNFCWVETFCRFWKSYVEFN